MRAARVAADRPPKTAAAVRRRVRPEREMVKLRLCPQRVEDHARLNPRGQPAAGFQLEDAVHVLREIEDHGDVAALAGQAHLGAARKDRRAVLPAHRDGGDHIALGPEGPPDQSAPAGSSSRRWRRGARLPPSKRTSPRTTCAPARPRALTRRGSKSTGRAYQPQWNGDEPVDGKNLPSRLAKRGKSGGVSGGKFFFFFFFKKKKKKKKKNFPAPGPSNPSSGLHPERHEGPTINSRPMLPMNGRGDSSPRPVDDESPISGGETSQRRPGFISRWHRRPGRCPSGWPTSARP